MQSPFRPAGSLLVQYARYHRDRRNINCHLVGIPLIVFAIAVLLARPAFAVAGVTLTPIWIVWALATLWYLSRSNLALGVVVSLGNGVLVALAQPIASAGTAMWLGWGFGLFVLGWIVQAIGHFYEGRKPAFLDDLIGLLVGPMFIVAELLFTLGWGRDLRQEIERGAGPTVAPGR